MPSSIWTVQVNVTRSPRESRARFLRAVTKVIGIRFSVACWMSIALVPETFKRRNYFLAHWAKLKKPGTTM